MNRIIIIGNGFDLAHNIKSDFRSFIFNYLEKSLRIFLEQPYEGYIDKLIVIKTGKWFQKTNEYENLLIEKDALSVIEYLSKNEYITISYLYLMEKIIREINWVDIEFQYFKFLSSVSRNTQIVDVVNNQFEYLKELLIEYLKEQEEQFNSNNINSNYLESLGNCFREKIDDKEVYLRTNELSPTLLNINKIYFLNFNYTNTLFPYYRLLKNSGVNCSINYIHGSINSLYGKPIFGFGDELNEDYNKFEEMENNSLYTYIKSFGYFDEQNYFSLINILNNELFQVHIYGHSCGLSDRTLLNEIFEHENCRSIKLFYYNKGEGKDDYTEKTYAINKHFKDKKSMRKKIVAKSLCNPMPQLNDYLS